jgi:hypothetical protein
MFRSQRAVGLKSVRENWCRPCWTLCTFPFPTRHFRAGLQNAALSGWNLGAENFFLDSVIGLR